MKVVVQYFSNLQIKTQHHILSLNSNKASGPNSIPYRVLFLRKYEISKQLADLFNHSFMTVVFPSVLKTAKVAPVFKERFKIRL